MLGDVVKELNQGLRTLAAERQDSTEAEGRSEVTSAATMLLTSAGKRLAKAAEL